MSVLRWLYGFVLILAVFTFTRAQERSSAIGSQAQYEQWKREVDEGIFFVVRPPSENGDNILLDVLPDSPRVLAPQAAPKPPTEPLHIHFKAPHINTAALFKQFAARSSATEAPLPIVLTPPPIIERVKAVPVVEDRPVAPVASLSKSVPAKPTIQVKRRVETIDLLEFPDAIMDAKQQQYAINCPNNQGVPCISKREADNRVRSCCQSVGIAKSCQEFCVMEESVPQHFLRALQCKDEDWPEVQRCVAGGKNLIPCCQRKAVHPKCIQQCYPDSGPPPLNAYRELLCAPFTHTRIGMAECFYEAMGPEPTNYESNPDIVEIAINAKELEPNADLARLVGELKQNPEFSAPPQESIHETFKVEISQTAHSAVKPQAAQIQPQPQEPALRTPQAFESEIDQRPVVQAPPPPPPPQPQPAPAPAPKQQQSGVLPLRITDGLANRCPNELDIPCISRSEGHERVLDCCKNVGVNSYCHQFCNLDISWSKVRRLQNEPRCPPENQSNIRKCLGRQQNVMPCCLRKGVPSACLQLCDTSRDGRKLSSEELLANCSPLIDTLQSVTDCLYLAQPTWS